MKSILTVLLVLISVVLFAQKAQLGTAYAQITSVMRESVAQKNGATIYYSVIAKWKGDTPQSVFLHTKDIWGKCIAQNRGKEINLEDIAWQEVEFQPIKLESAVMPPEIKQVPLPALIFRVKNKWYYLPLKNIREYNHP
jgi:hypothetical protein